MFAVSENIAMFVVRTLTCSVESFDFTGNRFYKAGLISTSQSVYRACREFAKLGKSLASFVISIHQIFRRKMRTLAENLNQTAQGASASTADTRNRVSYSTLKSQEKTYCVLVIGHVSVQSRWFGHGCKEIVTAHSEHAAITKAINRYSRRSTALPIQAVIVLPDTCTTSDTPDYVR